MKNLFLTIAFIFTVSLTMNAQVSIKPGVRAGANISTFTQTSSTTERFTPKADFYTGGLVDFQFTRNFGIVPSVTYTRQGSYREMINNGIISKDQLNVHYISLSNVVELTFNKFKFMAGPSTDILLKNPNKKLNSNGTFASNESVFANSVLNFTFGIGYEIAPNLGIEARFKRGLSNSSNSYSEETVTTSWGTYTRMESISSMVFQLGLTYTFGSKTNKK